MGGLPPPDILSSIISLLPYSIPYFTIDSVVILVSHPSIRESLGKQCKLQSIPYYEWRLEIGMMLHSDFDSNILIRTIGGRITLVQIQ